MRILLVDDTAEIRELLADRMSPFAEIIQANCGDKAAELLETQQFDLIISDFKMPNGNGLVVLKAKLDHASNTPFFFFSSEIDLVMSPGISGIFDKMEIKKVIEMVAKAAS